MTRVPQDARVSSTKTDGCGPSGGTAEPLPRQNDGPALGQEAFAAIREVREAMQLPSWINHVPRGFGTSEHGKLSADQWHTCCTVLLPIALILLWGNEKGRKWDMLKNFMDLATAVGLAGMWRISSSHITVFEEHLHRYLSGLKELYKEAKLVPNHHLALHLPDFMRFFGPVQSWRSFVFERYNYILQNMNTNLTFGVFSSTTQGSTQAGREAHAIARFLGEMEGTFMRTACRAANLRPLLQDPRIALDLAEFLETYGSVSGEDERGMRLDSVLRSANAFVVPDLTRKDGASKEIKLDGDTYAALLAHLNARSQTPLFVDASVAKKSDDQRYLSRGAHGHSDIIIHGIHYRCHHASSRDSNVQFCSTSSGGLVASAGYIESIFTHRRKSLDGQLITETFLAVRNLEELSEADSAHDNFRKFPYAGGRLYYDRESGAVRVIRPQDILCHVARTSLKITGIASQCAHILPLDRVRPDTSGSEGILLTYRSVAESVANLAGYRGFRR